MSTCAKNLKCPKCGLTLANSCGGVVSVVYDKRAMVLSGLLGIQCRCGQQSLPTRGDLTAKAIELPHEWQKRAKRLACPTPGCKATHGYRFDDKMVVLYAGRLYVCRGLLYVACEQCHAEFEQGKEL